MSCPQLSVSPAVNNGVSPRVLPRVGPVPISARTGTPPSTSRWTGRNQQNLEEYLNTRATVSAMEQEWALMRQTMATLAEKLQSLESLVRRVEWRVSGFDNMRKKAIARISDASRKKETSLSVSGETTNSDDNASCDSESPPMETTVVQRVAGTGIELHLYPLGLQGDAAGASEVRGSGGAFVADIQEDGRSPTTSHETFAVVAVEDASHEERVGNLRVELQAQEDDEVRSSSARSSSRSARAFYPSHGGGSLFQAQNAYSGAAGRGVASGNLQKIVVLPYTEDQCCDEFIILCDVRKNPQLLYHLDGNLDY
ncbi:unnamed protein product [Amoebophrya sp. A25]|nr:unnamed protein product [Amoebophrya sp. A25]|eukprot:GSA25T00024146001.1